jgi:rhomboid protease GluP
MTAEDSPDPHATVEPADDEILTIGDVMLHRDRVDLEAGMSAAPRATILLIAACVAIFARQTMVGGLDNVARIVETGALQRDAVLDGEWWRLVSGAFMHADGVHLVGNMVMLYILGMACEHAFGLGRFLFLYTAAGIAGNALAMSGSDIPTVGASGAIFGLVGGTIGMAFVHRRELEVRDTRLGVVLAGWSAFTLLTGFFTPFVSNSAHFGGLVAGLVLGVALRPVVLDPRRVSRRPVVGRVLLTLTLLVLVATFAEFLPHLH